jgi:diguanylate cyclase (GGDEF)-like protein
MFVSLTNENFRRAFHSFYLLACLFPVLITLFVIYQHAVPVLSAGQLNELKRMFNVGAMSIVTVQMLGFFLLWWWVNSLEQFTAKVQHISSEHFGNADNPAEEAGNELLKLNRMFDRLNDELQDRIRDAEDSARQMRELSSKMSSLACTDDLTQLYNRRHFRLKFNEAAQKAQRLGHSVWLVRFEIDQFCNLGDKAGDILLKEVGRLVRKTLADGGIPFRIGRNEFAVIISDVDGKSAAQMTQALTSVVSTHHFQDKSGHSLGRISISCGIAGLKTDQLTLFADAGKALINAQRMGQPIAVAPAV